MAQSNFILRSSSSAPIARAEQQSLPIAAGAGAVAGAQVLGSAVGSTLGSVLSGAGQLTAAATVLETVGAATTLGIGLVGALPAAIAKVGLDCAFADSAELEESERAARRAARRGSSIGAVAGSLGVATAVTTLGGGIGTTGVVAGILSLGGGLVAGAAAVATAPAIATLTVGCGCYALAKNGKRRSAPVAE